MRDHRFPSPLFGGDGVVAGGPPASAPSPAPAPAPAPAPPPGSPPAAWYDAQDGLAQGLAPEQRTFLAGKGFKDLPSAISSAMEADRMVRDRNVLPRPAADKLAEWPGWKELGWKESRDEYQVKSPKVPDDISFDRGFEKHLVDTLHAGRVPLPAAQALIDAVAQYGVDHAQRLDATGARENEVLLGKLKTEWGQDFEANKQVAARAARFLGVGLDDSAELESVIGPPRLMQLMHKIGAMLGEDKLVSSGGAGGGNLSPSQIDAELNRLHADPEFMRAFTDARNPRNAEVTAQRNQLLERKAKLAA